MFTFLDFITEESGSGAVADAKGKAFELELAKHLHPKKQYPEHHNDESGRSPKVVAGQLKDRLGEHEYNTISKHAEKAAVEHIKTTGHKVSQVHWTSVAGQVSKTTGKKEDDHPADLVYKHGNKHYGISAKYGSAPGARSPGMKDLGHMSKSNPESGIAAHHKAVAEIMAPHLKGTTNAAKHQEFKSAVKGELGPKAKQAAEHANKTSLEHRSAIAGTLAKHFQKVAETDHPHMTEVVRKLTASHKTETPMLKVHHNPKTGKTDVSHPSEDFDKAMSKVKHFSVEHKGMYVNIHAHDNEGKKHTIAKVSIKNKSSSPFTNMVGSASLGNGLKKLSSDNGSK
jgi:hypothetical protein